MSDDGRFDSGPRASEPFEYCFALSCKCMPAANDHIRFTYGEVFELAHQMIKLGKWERGRFAMNGTVFGGDWVGLNPYEQSVVASLVCSENKSVSVVASHATTFDNDGLFSAL